MWGKEQRGNFEKKSLFPMTKMLNIIKRAPVSSELEERTSDRRQVSSADHPTFKAQCPKASDHHTTTKKSWDQLSSDSFSNFPAVYPGEEDLICIYEKCQNHPSQFAVNLARMLFTHEELRNSNCRGVKQKHALDKQRLLFIRNAVTKFYQIPASYQTDVWKQCMQGIDTRCRQERRPKYKDFVAAEFYTQN
ncbi:hypothetical protein HNY73_013849 [Argiope bruennichi]|uniref:BEN domain-containing protein n=1 Tax=Argiope bruennichi TaxID=94029 RepID=A0A8T0EM27_ARGBR|nr:hypothetical protein HNY73_013849 [Argiope bruennichi]